MKLSKTQIELLERISKDLSAIKKYKDYGDFFDNCKINEQITFPAGYACNSRYNTKEKYLSNGDKAAAQFARYEASWNLAKEQNIIIVFAKTETVAALERAGYIKVIKHAEYKGGAETIQLIKEV